MEGLGLVLQNPLILLRTKTGLISLAPLRFGNALDWFDSLNFCVRTG